MAVSDRAPQAQNAETAFNEPSELGMLWFGLAAGPTAFALDLGISYALVQWECGAHSTLLLHLISVLALLMALSGAVIARVSLRRVPSGAETDGGRAVDRSRFMAIAGLVFSVAFAVVIVANAIPRFVIGPCQS